MTDTETSFDTDGKPKATDNSSTTAGALDQEQEQQQLPQDDGLGGVRHGKNQRGRVRKRQGDERRDGKRARVEHPAQGGSGGVPPETAGATGVPTLQDLLMQQSTQLQKLQKKLKKLKKKNKQVEELKKQNKKFEEQNKKFDEELKKQKKQLKNVEDQKNKRVEELKKQNKQVEELKKQNKQFDEELKKQKKQLKNVEDQIYGVKCAFIPVTRYSLQETAVFERISSFEALHRLQTTDTGKRQFACSQFAAAVLRVLVGDSKTIFFGRLPGSHPGHKSHYVLESLRGLYYFVKRAHSGIIKNWPPKRNQFAHNGAMLKAVHDPKNLSQAGKEAANSVLVNDLVKAFATDANSTKDHRLLRGFHFDNDSDWKNLKDKNEVAATYMAKIEIRLSRKRGLLP